MKIMVTGGMGFVGSHLCESLLKENHNLIILTKSFKKKSNVEHIKTKIKQEKIDITNFSKLGKSIEKNKPDVLIHLAGQTSHSKSFENPVHDIDVNAKSTLFMLQKIKELNLKCRFVLGSTFIVIGKPERLPVNEKSICNPTTIYGANRLVSEYYCKIFNQVYGLDTLIFRITNSFGPREQIIKNKNAINYLIYEAFKGNKVSIYNNGNFYRDLIYISDVITGIKTIIKKGKKGNLYWVSSNKKTWFHQLGNWLTQFSNVKINYVNSPVYTQKVDVGNFVVDNSKLKLLGWKPKVSVKDGIKRTLGYFEDSNLK